MRISYFIPILAAFISLSGALLSWRQARRASMLTTNHSVGDAMLKINQLFVNEPELWPYMIQAKKPIPKKYQAKARIIATMMLNIFEAIWSQKKGMDKENQTAWENYICWQIQSVGVISDAYKSNYHWYPNLNKIVGAEATEPKVKTKKLG